MKYPKVNINLSTIKNNVKSIVEICNKQGIKVAGVTKVFCGDPEITKAYIEGGVSYLADSRVENLVKLQAFNIPKLMLRLPMKSEVEMVVRYADISLNSEIDTVTLLSEKAICMDKVHEIILMVDLGDLREGYYGEKSIFEAVEKIINLKGIKLIGLGTNLTCYGGIIPNKDTLDKLVELQRDIEKKYDLELNIISGGNSSTVHLLEDNEIKGINHLRLGESLVLGVETAYRNQIKRTRNDAFILQAEIIEIKTKPSMPIGKIGTDAFGNSPKFIDRGMRKRIICAVGKQDIEIDSLYPIDKGISIIGGSSDHLILDGEESNTNYKVGDIVEFTMSYVSILRAMTSKYIEKELVK